ncbi:SDR family NAD(P)-dependent oxidoreductase [Bradyrhizobium sp. CCGB12]|uniref:SDR family NAD(P)-dependent oxidoreductase n=1 Tax=Bradyrhizobium sp. CCGB12 TaxID=2949632 RepID=UPI0020B1E526|nr:SDR family NAD(P)-dependent oxidoreductase [Bradyrhizobium sp. CCGB12]MCP3387844.1 SDR family NAD(P)-dependent oxidoreductase [Bradyrhizobium sp. CCGB12]
MKVEGLSAVVTGGGSGLGAATAKALAVRGAKVAVVDLNADGAQAVAREVGGLAISADVTNEGDIEKALDQVAQGAGVPRILVNCAGVGGAIRTVGKNGAHPLDKFRQIINVNLIGTFNIIRLFAQNLSKLDPIGEERGVIVNTASVAAHEGQIGQAAYAASKAGVIGMTLPIARDLAQSLIRVNSIAPGIFQTPLLGGLSAEAQESLGRQVPHPARLGRPSEYAELAVHIVENPMINGETIRLDGGIRMGPR